MGTRGATCTCSCGRRCRTRACSRARAASSASSVSFFTAPPGLSQRPWKNSACLMEKRAEEPRTTLENGVTSERGAHEPLGSSRGAHNYPSPNAALTRTQAAAKPFPLEALPPATRVSKLRCMYGACACRHSSPPSRLASTARSPTSSGRVAGARDPNCGGAPVCSSSFESPFKKHILL
jgi:hypothetical protein